MSDQKIKKSQPRLPFKFAGRLNDQKGVTVIFVAILLVVLVGFVALAVDVGYLMVSTNELQNIADGAALAACRELGEIYRNLSNQEQQDYVYPADDGRLATVANAVGLSNQAGGRHGIVIRAEDVIIGEWDPHTFTPGRDQPNAVRVIARRDGDANNPITTFFARVLGINTVDLSREATAALTGQSTTEPGEIELPIGISSYFFLDGNFCNKYVKFYPTNDPDSCAGWNTYEHSPANANTLRTFLENDVPSPGTVAGDTQFTFTGGTLNTHIFNAVFELFRNKGYDTLADNITPVATDGDGNPITGHLGDAGVPMYKADGVTRALYNDGTPRNLHRWEPTLAVYEWEDCANPRGSITIVGYTTIGMTDVQGPPNHTIVGQVMCDLYSEFDVRGGGGRGFGLKGTIPNLVRTQYDP